MSKHLKLGQRNLAGDPHRIGTLVPLISDVSHGVTDCNHKPVPFAYTSRANDTYTYTKHSSVSFSVNFGVDDL